MAIDDLTDEAFFETYQKNPKIRELVDGIQIKYHTHFSQKGQPDYDEANIPIAMKEAKKTVQQLLAQQKQEPQAKTGAPTSTYYNILRLAATFAGIALLGLYFP